MKASPVPLPSAPDSLSLARILLQIMERVTEFLEVERTALFIHDDATGEMWSPVAEGTGEVRVPRGRGLSMHVFETGETVQLADAYSDPRFTGSIDRGTGFHTRDLYCRPVCDSTGKRIGVIQLLNRRRGPLTPREETLLDAICGQAGTAIENAQLFLRLKKVHDSEHTLHTALEAKHAELQRAFLRIEENAAAHALLSRRIQTTRLVAMLAGVALFVAIGLFAWLGIGGKKSSAKATAAPAAIAWHTVAAAPVRTGIPLLGNIEPLEIRNLTAPFRGRIAEKRFEYGELVTKDQLLAKLDATEVEVDFRNTEAAHFRAAAELSRLENWSKGPEVARAERALAKARLNFEANERNLREMDALFKLGIIAQASLDSARQQFATQEADFRAAEDELALVRAAATAERVTSARYDVENIRLRLVDLKAKLARTEIRAPFSGIVILPSTRPAAGRPSGFDGFYEQGMTINQSDILLAIGNLEGVAVKTRADEVDIARIRHEQPVIISGDAFSGLKLAGKIAYVSSQAVVAGGRPYFELIAKTGQLSAAELATVRLGMSARVDITVYEKASAVIVPVAAVRRAGGNATVFRRDAKGAPETVKVTTGVVLADAVEIRSGLSAGDVVAANAKQVP
ncbi:MAG: GAF domain-containing protein [Opitutaceae bacterium]|nr:GAF domain-containing protein [Opitutaceae bacterium]